MPEGLTIREFARREGCDEKVVRRKVQSGHLIALQDGSIDPKSVGTNWRQGGADSVRKMRTVADSDVRISRTGADTDENEARRIEEVAERLVSESTDRTMLSKADAERRKENFIALLRELEYDRASGAVAEIEDIVSAVASEYALVRNKLMNIGSRIAPRAVVMRSAEEIKALIDREVREALQELTQDATYAGPRAA